ncbi:peptidylprolyl isomerase [Anabaena sp. UHCC 0187]|uniref:peptidylprolyl isomerase n=1 Tax=Anabaena sp. UHCC 0187 TaxID=2590018 RepID=UPI0014464943|nr:peptidylprolyl isomerase [Anabaena sp. UHCC 0187]MDP5016828.1 peptidylprolyl isomerase [Dolichospermum sp.]MTJ14475.1 peptidylprolyl isomerase [Anabaena sp. UHCC 0187]
MNQVLQLGDRTLQPSEVLSLLSQYQLLPLLIKEIILDQATAEIVCTPEEEKLACEQLAQQYQGIEQQGESFQQLKMMATRSIKLEKFKETTWGGDLNSYFFQRKGQLDRVIYSLITTTEIGIAQEIYFRIQEGEQSFAALAREYAQGPEAQTDGLVGPIDLQSLHPTLVNILSKSQPQQLSPPTQINNLFVIVRLEKLLPAQLDRSMRQRLLNERFNQWLQGQMKEQTWQIQTS